MKIYKTPPQRRKKKDINEDGGLVFDGDEVEASLNQLHPAKDLIANNSLVSYISKINKK